MGKHTPGPWKYRTCYDTGEPCEYAVEGDNPEHEGPIATVHITVDNDEQDYANARLIAAAPDLLEALKEIGEWDPAVAPGDPCGMSIMDAIDIARAAIAKAEAE